jgi:predicted small metal-binding protein
MHHAGRIRRPSFLIEIVLAVLAVTVAALSQSSTTPAHNPYAGLTTVVYARCGFTVTSHEENELLELVKAHARKFHDETLTDQQVREMIDAGRWPDAGAPDTRLPRPR